MDDDEKKKLKKNGISHYFQSFYDNYENYSIGSVLLRIFGVCLYFSQMISYNYFFAINKVTNTSAQYICYLHYYLNLVNLMHDLKFFRFSLFIFALFYSINFAIFLNISYRILVLNFFIKKQIKAFFFIESIIYRFSNLFIWHIMIFSIEIFMMGFLPQDNYLKTKLSSSDSYILKAIGIFGIILSVVNGAILFYFNQDLKFLDKSKMRFKLSIKTICCFLVRIFQAILFNVAQNELIFFLMNYFFLLINFLFYVTNLPFKNKKLSIFFISYLLHSFSHLIILTFFRLDYLINEYDLLPIDLIFLLFCIKIGEKIYNHFYFFYLLYEDRNKKIPIFVLEELIDLYMSLEKKKKNMIFLFGYFAHHPKYCFNSNCTQKNKNFLLDEKNESQKKYLIDFIYENFKDLLEHKKILKYNEENYEILIAKFISFLLTFGLNPVLSFYEIQKTLSTKNFSSLYFEVLAYSIKNSIKKELKFFLRKKELDSPSSNRKNTYQAFFKSMETKKQLEKKFKRIVTKKIIFFEKTLIGFQNLKDLFLSNLRLAFLIKSLKNDIKKLNETATYSKIFKCKFSSLINSLILNKIADANLSEKHLNEYIKSKNEGQIDKSFLYDFFGDETVVCEASFIDYKGKILEKSKTPKLMRFFGYFSEDRPKFSYVNNLMPDFIQKPHEKYMLNYIEQKNKYQKSELFTFAIDHGEFVFPIILNVTLKYYEQSDFVFFGAFSKIHDFPKMFCLCDMEGEILNISKEFFDEFIKEYEFLKVSDFSCINIFQLIPDFNPLINNSALITSSQDNNYKLYFPKEMKTLIDHKKEANARENENSTFKNNKSCNTILKNFKVYKNISIHNETKFAEITFNLSVEHYGYADSLVNFLIFSIIKFKKIDLISENINNTTIIKNINENNDQVNQNPQIINLFAYEEKRKEHFGMKLNLGQQNLQKEKAKDQPVKSKENKIVTDSERYSVTGKIKVKPDSIHFSSTSSEFKSDLAVFTAFKKLKKMYPQPLKFTICLIFLQILLSFIFSAVYLIYSTNYIDTYFKPIQIGVREFSLQYHFNGVLMLSNTREEYFYLNLINITERPEYSYFIPNIYEQSIGDVKNINDRFRNKILGRRFETFYRTRLTNYCEGFDYQIKKVTYIDFIDKMINNANRNLPNLAKLNELLIYDFEDILFLVRNFPFYLSEGSFIYNELINEFATSDQEINNDFFNVLIIFIIVWSIVKIYEIFQWLCFMNLLKNILTIYLRISEDELRNEIDHLKFFLKLMKESNDKYFSLNLSDKPKNEINFKAEISHNINKNGTIGKKGRRAMYSRLQGLPKLLLCLYYFICSMIMSFYLIFSYYNWIIVDKYITSLTNTNTLFSTTYIYSSSIVFLEDMLYREKIIRNLKFEKIDNTLQTKAGRLQFFKTALDKRMNMIANTSTMNIILDGIDDSRKAAQLRHLLNGNLCELLSERHHFNEKQISICENMMNGAFKKGLGTALSEMFKSIKNRELSLQYLPKDNIDDQKQQERIKLYIKSSEFFDMYLTEFYLHELLEKYYDINHAFYNDSLDQELSGFYNFLYLSLFFILLMNILIFYTIKTKIRFIYQSTCRVLYLIPYERMIKDEQMLNFLKRLSKKN